MHADVNVSTTSTSATASKATGGGVKQRGWRLALAGGIAGAISNTLLHPLDTVKTVRQSDPSSYRGVLRTAGLIARTRGPGALYAGLGPALLGSALSSALYFGSYEAAKQRLKPALRGARVAAHACSAVCGNVASSILFVPKEVVKQRMQAGVSVTGSVAIAGASAGAGFVNAARSVVAETGVLGLYRGYKATLLRNIPSTMLRFVLFEEFRRKVAANTNPDARRPLSLAQYLVAGALAGAIASGITTPLDVVKTRIATGRIKFGTGVLSALRTIHCTEGVRGLYAGVRPRVLWSALGTGVGFGSYELCKSLLQVNSEPSEQPEQLPAR